jgi:cell division protein FtsN
VTRNALVVATILMSVLALATLAGCSREKLDWKSAESADTVEGYDHFIERHPEGELAAQARARVAQLNEDRDWKRATAADTADAYRQFLAQHESGKWAEEARIRVENFSLDGAAAGPATPAASPAVAAKPVPEPKMSAAPKAAAADKHVAAAKPATSAKPAAAPSATRAAAPAAVASAAAPQFGIQLGAFHSQDAALNNWKQLQVKFDSDLHGLFARAVPMQQSSGQLYRLQAPVGEETRARAICESLKKKSQACVVVLPLPQ